jgi:hypothetical protein
MKQFFERDNEERFGHDPQPDLKLGRLPSDALRISAEDREILRGLGRRKHEAANLPVMAERRQRWFDTNDLRMTKPPIFVDEICWAEMNEDHGLDLRCSHPFAQELEEVLRRELYCFDHDLGDLVVEDYIECPVVVYDSGFHIEEHVEIKHSDRNSEVVSRHFEPYILTMDDVEKIKEPEIYADWERTEQYKELLEEIFDGILPVRVIGSKGLWFTPWDYLIRVMGINETMCNLIDDPDFIEAAVKRYVHCAMVRMDKYRSLGIWASNNSSCRVGSGGYGFCSALAPREEGLTHCGTDQMWGCGNAQIFTSVSPAMHWQFSLQYEMEWLKCFGVTYYGCCEPLHHKMDILDKIPNLRKVSMSPWSKKDVAAPRCRGKYVMSCKPSPAIFSVGEFDEELARKAIEDIIRQTEGCSIEIIMKDISTVAYRPEKLWKWAKIARETVDGIFG